MAPVTVALLALALSAGARADGLRTAAALHERGLALYPGAGYAVGGSPLVRGVQRLLARAGDRPGASDGLYGPVTEEAVRRFQADRGLRVDGIAGAHTIAALLARNVTLYPGAGEQSGGSRLVGQMQRRLAQAGDPPGPIDGVYGPLTERAVRRFQSDRAMRVNGVAGPVVLVRLHVPVEVRRARARGRTRTPAPIAVRRAPVPIAVRAPSRASAPAVWLVLLGVLLLGLVSAGWHFVRGRFTSPASQSDDDQPGHAAGAFRLGTLLERQGDAAGAQAAYRRADEHRHGVAASNLGVLLERQGDLAGAEAAYRRADGRGDARGAFNLGTLLEEQDDPAGAEAAYRRADERGHAAAATNLGVLLERQGDLAGAEAAYRRADERGDANGAFNLGALLEERDDLAGAQAAYLRANEGGDIQVAQMARAALGELGELSGRAPAKPPVAPRAVTLAPRAPAAEH